MLGILLKIGYDLLAARRASKSEALGRFAPERREAYEKFLAAVHRQQDYYGALYELVEARRRGEEVRQERLNAFPASPMGDLGDALEEVRRLARTYAVISSAENIFRLFLDMIAAFRAALDTPGPNDQIIWFVLQRFQEDRIREFVHAYREDLGFGYPIGGPKDYPLPKRPWPLDTSEAILRAHLPKEGSPIRSAGEARKGAAYLRCSLIVFTPSRGGY